MTTMAGRIRALGDVAVVAAFAALSLLPMALGSADGSTGEEGRSLAPKPALPSSIPGWAVWTGAYERWFNDHFGGREKLLELNSRVAMQVFGVSPTDQVVLGKDGWLYFTKEELFADRRGEARLREAELEQWRTVLEGRKAWLATRGIPYVFAVPPNKVTVHPEHLPARHRSRPDLPTRMDQITAHLRAHSSFAIVDLRPVFAEAAKSGPIYHATDSHWNEIGGYLGYCAMLDGWRQQGVAIEALPLAMFEKRTGPRRGDLVPLIPHSGIPAETSWFLAPREPLPGRRVELPPEWRQVPSEWGVWETTVVYENETGNGVLLSIGDSFMWQIMPLLASHFRRTVFVSALLMDFEVLQAMVGVVQPTVVLEERVERNVKWLPRPHPVGVSGG